MTMHVHVHKYTYYIECTRTHFLSFILLYLFSHTRHNHPAFSLTRLWLLVSRSGLPTIVGISGGLIQRLKTGMRVHVDTGKGKITMVREEEREEDKSQLDA